jgi:transposase InsO family protein
MRWKIAGVASNGGQHSCCGFKESLFIGAHCARALDISGDNAQRKDLRCNELPFGLNSAPKVMTAIFEAVREQDPVIAAATSSYIDDILVNTNKVSVSAVVKHFARYGLATKPPELITSPEGIRALGLRVQQKIGKGLFWERDGKLNFESMKTEGLTKRKMYAKIEELLGHFPVAGWLRVACTFLQRIVGEDSNKWDDPISSKAQGIFREVCDKVQAADPVNGKWDVDTTKEVTLWTDASDLALGIVLEVDGHVVEDGSWLRQANDTKHINVSELDAAIKGVNLCLRWGIRKFRLMTDSATVVGWFKCVFQDGHRVRTRALSEALISRRLDILRETKDQYGLKVDVVFVRSEQNKADRLTRVPKIWLRPDLTENATTRLIREVHAKHHFGVEKTYNVIRQDMNKEVTRTMVRDVISRCEVCSRISPAVNLSWNYGDLSSENVWERLEVDVTHVCGASYLSMIDCCSRFTVWKRLKTESACEIANSLHEVFSQMGPPRELLSDNGTVFRKEKVKETLANGEVEQRFSCANRPQGNGLCERVHKTVKIMKARTGWSVEEMVFWYNVSRSDNYHSPYEQLFGATPIMPGISEK